MINRSTTTELVLGDELNREAKDLLHETGVLDAISDQLNDESTGEDVDPEAVGKWITAIGKALLAIFK